MALATTAVLSPPGWPRHRAPGLRQKGLTGREDALTVALRPAFVRYTSFSLPHSAAGGADAGDPAQIRAPAPPFLQMRW